jgi:hypothetical protein
MGYPSLSLSTPILRLGTLESEPIDASHVCLVYLGYLGACPTLTILLRRMICNHLRRSRPEKILNVFRRMHLRFFRALRRSSGRPSFAS